MAPILDRVDGCPVDSNGTLCFGPKESHWRIFGTELRRLDYHFMVSLILGLLVFGLLELLERRGRIDISIYRKILVSLVSILAIFLVLAYMIPIQVYY